MQIAFSSGTPDAVPPTTHLGDPRTPPAPRTPSRTKFAILGNRALALFGSPPSPAQRSHPRAAGERQSSHPWVNATRPGCPGSSTSVPRSNDVPRVGAHLDVLGGCPATRTVCMPSQVHGHTSIRAAKALLVGDAVARRSMSSSSVRSSAGRWSSPSARPGPLHPATANMQTWPSGRCPWDGTLHGLRRMQRQHAPRRTTRAESPLSWSWRRPTSRRPSKTSVRTISTAIEDDRSILLEGSTAQTAVHRSPRTSPTRARHGCSRNACLPTVPAVATSA